MSIRHPGLERWHQLFQTADPEVQIRHLDALLHDDVVFHSPVAHRPVEGKMATALYLQAASRVLVNDHWRYVRELVDGRHAGLEFMTELEGTVINGIDLITFDDDAHIVDFKVMVRPFRAVEKLRDEMTKMVAALGPG
jgi:predicted nicotinamide N-methyase